MSLMSKLWPNADFWANFISKMFSFLVSFKAYLIALTTVLLFMEKLDGGTWATVIVSLGLGRVVIQSIEAKVSQNQEIPVVPVGE